MARLIKLVFILLLAASASAADIIPSHRVTDWTLAGCPDSIIAAAATSRTNVFNVRDFGAVGDGVTDDYGAFSNAFWASHSGDVIYVPPGRYCLSKALYYPTTVGNFTIRGAGPASVLLPGAHEAFWFGSSDWPSPKTNSILTADAERGTSTITVANASGFDIGTIIAIDQLNDSNFVGGNACSFCDLPRDGTRQLCQRSLVTGTTSNTITFSPPLVWTFRTNLQAKAWKQNLYYKNYSTAKIGIEDLTIIQGSTTAGINLIVLDTVAQCWIKNVSFEEIDFHGIYMYNSVQCEVSGCTFKRSAPLTTSNRGYGVEAFKCSFVKFENNAAYRLQAPFMMSSTVASVMGYNYATNIYAYADTNWLSGAFIPGHGSHSMFCLMEGNIGGMLQPDNYFGSISHHTAFRNHFSGWDVGVNQNRKCVDFGAWCLSNNVVGNVIGCSNQTWDYYIAPQIELSYDDSMIYRFGFPNMGNYVTNGYDTRVQESVLLHANYDYFTNAVRWDEGITNRTFPDSLYLSSKPTWFSNATWPVVDATVPIVALLPAQMRYLGIDYSGTNVPTPPSPVSRRVGTMRVGTVRQLPRLFQPPATAVAWWDAASGVLNSSGAVAANGNRVAQWGDRIAGRVAAQATDGARPYWTNYDGRVPALRFSRDNNTTAEWLAAAVPTAWVQTNHIFVAYHRTLGGANMFLVDGTNSAARNAVYVNGDEGYSVYAGDTAYGDANAARPDTNRWSVLRVVLNGANCEAQTNGAAFNLLSNVSNAGNDDMDGVTIGARYDGASHWRGFIGEVMILNGPTEPSEVERTWLYFSNKYRGLW